MMNMTSGKIMWVLHGRGGDKQLCLTEQAARDGQSPLIAEQTHGHWSWRAVPWLAPGRLGGAAILLISAVRLGGAAIREGAANRDNTVFNNIAGRIDILRLPVLALLPLA